MTTLTITAARAALLVTVPDDRVMASHPGWAWALDVRKTGQTWRIKVSPAYDPEVCREWLVAHLGNRIARLARRSRE